jgi:ubiquitin C-terminal hydrolase
LISERFSPVVEHDSHEFLLYFLNNLRDELTDKSAKLPVELKARLNLGDLWNEFSRKFPSEIDRLFTVIENTQTRCDYCSTVTNTL